LKLNRFLTWTAMLAWCVMLVGCSSDDNTGSDAGKQYSTKIYMLAADSGQLTPGPQGSGSATWTLTLKNPGSNALWYTDRPGQEVGATPIKDYVTTVWRDAYGNVNPNATAQFQLEGDNELEGVYVSLSNPSYNENAGTLTFQAELLNETLAQDLTSAQTFNNVTLNVLNNAVDDKPVSSYIQYAEQATLQPTGAANQFKVVLSDAGPDMFWVDNAPGKYSDSRPMSYFFPQWPYVFKDSPPNAALFGTTAAGELKLYFLTLTDPVYNQASGQASYTATLLGQTAGALETIKQAVLSIDSGAFSRFPLPGKGTAYQAFGQGYDPSTANSSSLYFGSDIARKQMGSLWGTQSFLTNSCAPDCRNDLQTIKNLGINLIRLYDWDPRNDHSQFLDYANSLNIKVVVPISNWLPKQSSTVWDEQVPGYFSSRNFGNKAGTDWHPAIAGVIISNELDSPSEDGGIHYVPAIGLVARFLQEADKRGFSKTVPVGIPVTFVPRGEPFGPGGQNLPGWNQFNKLLTDPRTAPYKDRLMLCANTYNDKVYLTANAEGTGEGWIPLTYKQFGAPILFTEIGYSRAKPDYSQQYVHDQLQSVLDYQKANPQQVLGAMHFQFDDKVWKQTPGDTDTEGAFGMFHHGAIVRQIPTVQADYDFYADGTNGNFGTLTIDKLDQTSIYTPVVDAYK